MPDLLAVSYSQDVFAIITLCPGFGNRSTTWAQPYMRVSLDIESGLCARGEGDAAGTHAEPLATSRLPRSTVERNDQSR